MKFSEVIDELESCTMVCAEISKEELKDVFERKNRAPRNEDLEEDDSYVAGEVQYLFEKDMSDVQEVLVYPVYDDGEGGFINGDFIPAPNEYWSEEAVSEAKDYAKEHTSGEIER